LKSLPTPPFARERVGEGGNRAKLKSYHYSVSSIAVIPEANFPEIFLPGEALA